MSILFTGSSQFDNGIDSYVTGAIHMHRSPLTPHVICRFQLNPHIIGRHYKSSTFIVEMQVKDFI